MILSGVATRRKMERDVVPGIAGLMNLIQSELDAQNSSWRQLAISTGMSESTFSKWRSEPDRQPDIETLALISVALDISLRRLIEACGFPIDEPGEYRDTQARARAILSAVPQMQPMIEQITSLPPDDQEDILKYVEYRVRRHRQGKGRG